MQLTTGFVELLEEFVRVFNAPTFLLFVDLMTARAPVLYGLIVAWFDRAGHRYVQFPNRPWYPRKEEPSFADMLTTLRRRSWEDKMRDVYRHPRRRPTRFTKKTALECPRFPKLSGSS